MSRDHKRKRRFELCVLIHERDKPLDDVLEVQVTDVHEALYLACGEMKDGVVELFKRAWKKYLDDTPFRGIDS